LISDYKKLIYSIVLETIAIGSLKFPNPYVAFFTFFFFHSLASLLFTVFIHPLLPNSYRKAKGSLEAVFFSVFLFPIFGYIAYLVIYIFILRFQEKKVDVETSRIPLDEITIEKIKIRPRKFGEAAFHLL